MKRTIEVELRFRITESDDFDTNIPFSEAKKIVDKYYDTKDGLLYKRGIFLRERNNKVLDFKFNLEDIQDNGSVNDHTHCDEYSFNIPFQPEQMEKLQDVCNILDLQREEIDSLKDFLLSNRFIELVVVDKTRRMGEKNGFEICLDQIKNAGIFIEVEKLFVLDDGKQEYQEKLDQVKEDIRSFVRSLGIETMPFESGYVELILSKKDYDLYKQGKYVMNADKN